MDLAVGFEKNQCEDLQILLIIAHQQVAIFLFLGGIPIYMYMHWCISKPNVYIANFMRILYQTRCESIVIMWIILKVHCNIYMIYSLVITFLIIDVSKQITYCSYLF